MSTFLEGQRLLPEPVDAIRRGEGVERNVPVFGRNEVAEALERPAEADEASLVLLQADESAVVMALAAAEAGAAPVDRDQRHQDEIGLDHRMALLGLHHSERAGLERIA